MSHFARIENIDDKWIVQEVHVINNDVIGEPELSFPDTEPLGQAFQASLGLSGIWKQTSYNNNFRKQYAGIGDEYNFENDVFIFPQPFASWTLDQNFDWQPPMPRPENGVWIWNENILNWEEITQ